MQPDVQSRRWEGLFLLTFWVGTYLLATASSDEVLTLAKWSVLPLLALFFALAALVRTARFVEGLGTAPLGVLLVRVVSKSSPSVILLSLFVLYLAAALVFAGMYAAWPDLLVQPAGRSEPITGWTCLYFSAASQATLTYGDFAPTGGLRAVTVVQGIVGIVIISATLSFVVFRLTNRQRLRLAFPRVAVYDPRKHTLQFRFRNEDFDDLTRTKIRVGISRILSPEEDPFVSATVNYIQLATNTDVHVPPGLVMALRSVTNEGRDVDPRPSWRGGSEHVFTPWNVIETDTLSLSVLGELRSSGHPIQIDHHYAFDEIVCGTYMLVDSRKGKSVWAPGFRWERLRLDVFHEHEGVPDEECVACPFHARCSFQPAKRLRSGGQVN